MKNEKQHKDEKLASLLTELAARYFAVESNRNSLMTVTRTEVYDKGKHALVYFTALPESEEPNVLLFAKRKNRDFRKFVMENSSLGFVPHINFEVDHGEHNRQRIDELLQKG